MRKIDLAGVQVPVMGQGTWRMGEDRHQHAREVAALREGLDLGLSLIDTAEMYGEGGAEQVVGEAIAGRRDEVFLVSKVYPHNASLQGVQAACERSLKRLGCERIDLYLLHWRGRYPLAETVEGFERLRAQGKIGAWGVSNFDLDDLLELDQPACQANQVLYNSEARGIEYDLLPWQQRAGMPLMAYCPLSQAGALLHEPVMRQVAERHGATAAQIALAWTLRQDGVIAIPKAASSAHLRDNAAATAIALNVDDLNLLDEVFAPPRGKQPLEMV
ncbi:aldo/keto reductase [Pseudomonas sp. o96-267]|uniref:aldo/keto reductase n=1 Tax=Pseudomonas sp. o96-267 TaxID=2479853 RepID=UPI000F77C3B6|nr:aldo/keto reductase [Pseudomonas sp. o96-267]RRV42546.1 aldo/keto reductase [Pseudomonas sp. o96-267]